MTDKERLREIVVLISLLLVVFVPTAVLFFSDGGEIRGFSNTQENSGVPQVIEVDGIVIVPITDGEIVPVYDDAVINTYELWQLHPREIFREYLMYPFTYIPPSVSKIISLIYLASGLAFIVLYRKVSEKNRSSESRREQIYRYICENPGKSQQQITDAMQIHRSTLKYHLLKLEKSEEIHTNDYGEYPRYFPSNKGLTKEKKIILSLISEEKDYTIFRMLLNHPGLTRKELAADLGLSEATTGWHLTRLKKYSLLIPEKHEKEVQYTLTPDAVTTYRTIVPDADSSDA